MTRQRSRSVSVLAKDGMPVPSRVPPSLMAHRRSPSLVMCRRTVQRRSAGGGDRPAAAGPLPAPVLPWQLAQLVWKMSVA